MPLFLTSDVLVEILSVSDLRSLPASDPGNGYPYLMPDGTLRVDSGSPTLPGPTVLAGKFWMTDGLGGTVYGEPALLDAAAIEAALDYVPADDSLVMHLAGAETVTGAKRFNEQIGLNGYAKLGGVSAGVAGLYANDGTTLGTLQAAVFDNPTGTVVLTSGSGSNGSLRVDLSGGRTRWMDQYAYPIDIQSNDAVNPLLRVTASGVPSLSIYADHSRIPDNMTAIRSANHRTVGFGFLDGYPVAGGTMGFGHYGEVAALSSAGQIGWNSHTGVIGGVGPDTILKRAGVGEMGIYLSNGTTFGNVQANLVKTIYIQTPVITTQTLMAAAYAYSFRMGATEVPRVQIDQTQGLCVATNAGVSTGVWLRDSSSTLSFKTNAGADAAILAGDAAFSGALNLKVPTAGTGDYALSILANNGNPGFRITRPAANSTSFDFYGAGGTVLNQIGDGSMTGPWTLTDASIECVPLRVYHQSAGYTSDLFQVCNASLVKKAWIDSSFNIHSSSTVRATNGSSMFSMLTLDNGSGQVGLRLYNTGTSATDANISTSSTPGEIVVNSEHFRVGTSLYVNNALNRVGIGVASDSALKIGGDQVLIFQSSGVIQNIASIQTPSSGSQTFNLLSSNVRMGGDVTGGRLNVVGTADSLIPVGIQQGSGGTATLLALYDSSSVQQMQLRTGGITGPSNFQLRAATYLDLNINGTTRLGVSDSAIDVTATVRPSSDLSQDLGQSGRRFSTFYGNHAVFSNGSYPLGSVKIRQADNTGPYTGSSASNGVSFCRYVDGLEMGAIYCSNGGLMTISSAFDSHITPYYDVQLVACPGGYGTKLYGDAGLAVRNRANTADATITAGAATFTGPIGSYGIDVTGSNSSYYAARIKSEGSNIPLIVWSDSGGSGITASNPYTELIYLSPSFHTMDFYTNGVARLNIGSTGATTITASSGSANLTLANAGEAELRLDATSAGAHVWGMKHSAGSLYFQHATTRPFGGTVISPLVISSTGNATFSGAVVVSATSGVPFTVNAYEAGFTAQNVYVNSYGTLVSTIVEQAGNSGYAILQPGDTYGRVAIGTDAGTPYLGYGPGSGARDVFLRRYATGPAMEVRAAGGLRVRDLADTAYSTLRAGTIIGTKLAVGAADLGTALDFQGGSATAYSAAGLNLHDSTASVYNLSSTVGSYAQLVLITRDSATAYTRLATINNGVSDGDFVISNNSGEALRISNARNLTVTGDVTLATTKYLKLINSSRGGILKSNDASVGIDGLTVRDQTDAAYAALVCAGFSSAYLAGSQNSGGLLNATLSGYRTIFNRLDTGTMVTQSTGVYGWAATDGFAFSTNNDTGLARDVAGVVEINNGVRTYSGGTYGSLKAKSVTLNKAFVANEAWLTCQTAGVQEASLQSGISAGYGGTLKLIAGGVDYISLRANAGYPRMDIGGTTFGLYATGCTFVMGGSYISLTHSSNEYLRVEGSLKLRGDITQSYAAGVDSPSARWQMTAAGTRVGAVGNGSGTWQTAIQETYVASAAAKVETSIAQLSGDPTTSDVAAGFHLRVKNTTTGEISDWINDGGVMKRATSYSAVSTGWSATGHTPTKTFDASTATLADVSDVLGTLLTRLIDAGAISA